MAASAPGVVILPNTVSKKWNLQHMGKKPCAEWSIIQTAVAPCSKQCKCKCWIFSLTVPLDSLVYNTAGVNISAKWIQFLNNKMRCLPKAIFLSVYLSLSSEIPSHCCSPGEPFVVSCQLQCHSLSHTYQIVKCVFFFLLKFVFVFIFRLYKKVRGELAQLYKKKNIRRRIKKILCGFYLKLN